MIARIARAYRVLVSDPWLMLFAVVCVYIAISGKAPVIEGKLFPVTVNTQIESVERSEDGNSLVKLTFENQRDCKYSELTWFKTDKEGRTESVYVNFLDDAKTGSRGEGKHKTQTWYVKIPSDILRDYSLVKVRHSCHFLWDTVTKIYP